MKNLEYILVDILVYVTEILRFALDDKGEKTLWNSVSSVVNKISKSINQ